MAWPFSKLRRPDYLSSPAAPGGVPAVVADGVTGLLTPIGDADAFAAAVAHLLDAPQERARLGGGRGGEGCVPS